MGDRDDLLPPDLGAAQRRRSSPPGRAAAEKAAALGAKTDRERGYIAAIDVFYRGSDKIDHRTRAAAYETALEDLSRRFPDDHEAMIFYAMMLVSTAPPDRRDARAAEEGRPRS